MSSPEDSGLSIGSSLADVLRMRPSLIEKLALCLDRKMRLIPNWKHLSQELNVDAAVISSLEEYSDFSPTIRLFEYLEVTQPDLTIQQLKQAFSDIRRNDLYRLITTKAAGCTDSELVKEVITTKDVQSPSPQAGLLDDIALELDTKSKILKNWSGLAERLGVPRKDFRQFDRQSTIDPTCQLFQYLAVTRPQMTLKTLREALVVMTRNDLITIFRDRNLGDEVLLKDAMTPESELLQTVAGKLNVEQVPVVQNWRHLAHHLGIPHDVYREFDRTEPRKSPTKEVMQWLKARSPDITLVDVVKALDKIQRNDAIQIITEQFPDTVDSSFELLNFELPNDPTGEAFYASCSKEEKRISNAKEEVSKQPGRCGSLPDEAYDLKGREDVCEQIIKSLVLKKAVEIVAPPGYGKTSVVVKVAHKLITKYGNFIAYVNPRGVTCVEDLASEIIEALDGIPGENTIKQCLHIVRSLKHNNVVLIIENLDDLLHLEKNQKHESSRPVGEEFCAKMRGKIKKDDFLTFIKEIGQTRTIHLVLTSTETNDFSVSFPTELIELQPLSDDNSSALFQERDSGLDGDTIKKLVTICGGIPLIICTVLSLLKKRNPKNLARRLSNCTPFELIRELSPDFLAPEDRIENCLQACFCRLSQENQDVLVMLSTFPHRFVQEQVFTVFQSLTKLDLEKCINSLKHCSLLRFERNSCNYCIHPIIRKFCSTQPQHKQAKSSFIRHYSDLVISLNERFFSRDSKAVVEEYRAEKENFREATAWCEEEQVDLDQDLKDYCIDAFNKASVFLAKVMRKQEFESLFCKLSHQCRDDLRHSSCLTAIGMKIVLSCMCTPRICSRAWYRAQTVLSRANAIQSGLQKVDEATRAQCLSKLGFCFVREGRVDEGFEYLNQAVSVREKLYELSNKDGDKVMWAACYNDIAASLMLQRKHMAAIETRRNFVLPIYEKLLGKHPFLATTLSWIGKSYHELGLYDNAITFATQALNIRKTLLGRHQETARSYFDLGDALLAKKQFSRALEPLQRAAEMQEEVLDTYEELILTHQALAVVLKELGRDNEAEREMELAQECAKNVSSLDVPLQSRQKTDPMPIDRK